MKINLILLYFLTITCLQSCASPSATTPTLLIQSSPISSEQAAIENSESIDNELAASQAVKTTGSGH